MVSYTHIAYILIGGGLIALAFLIYTLLNLKKLNISLTHPRVIVELFCFVICEVIGIMIYF